MRFEELGLIYTLKHSVQESNHAIGFTVDMSVRKEETKSKELFVSGTFFLFIYIVLNICLISSLNLLLFLLRLMYTRIGVHPYRTLRQKDNPDYEIFLAGGA